MTKKKEKDVLLNHDYDGIQELDNDLPPWWLWLFYLTIIWGALYMLYYHVLGTGDSSAVEYLKEIDPNYKVGTQSAGFSIGYHSPLSEREDDLTPLSRLQLTQAREKEEAVRLAEEKARGEGSVNLKDLSFEEIILAAMEVAKPEDLNKLQSAFPDISDKYLKESSTTKTEAPAKKEEEIVIEPLTDEASLASGEAIFLANCATCHGKLGEGGIGPNFTDEYFLHGPTLGNMITVIKNGVAAKGMISWRGILKEEQILEVASYILTLRGTNPPNAKAPQGEKVDLTVK